MNALDRALRNTKLFAFVAMKRLTPFNGLVGFTGASGDCQECAQDADGWFHGVEFDVTTARSSWR